jgi:hypothetical protein
LQMLFPLIRRAASHYNDAEFKTKVELLNSKL